MEGEGRWIYVIAVLGDDRGCIRVWVTHDGMGWARLS